MRRITDTLSRSERSPDGALKVRGLRRLAAKWAMLAGVALAACGAALVIAPGRPVVASGITSTTGGDLPHPDAACARCHAEIYDRYERTTMARGSGSAREGMIAGEFRHAASKVDYRVFERDGSSWMSYARPAALALGSGSAALAGERQLLYYIGSGHRGRTFLYEVDGQWFELPINFYGKRKLWDMAPNLAGATSMPAPLPVDANCLHCHATGIGEAVPEARNRFPGAPFAQGGIGCSGCHGDGTEHLASGGRVPILNPDRLTAEKRDDVCLQCHLEGDAVVYRPGRSLAQFRPGDRLDEDAVYFVRASAVNGGRRATSQYEALLRSACKRASGDRLTCTTCHDPHSSPLAEQRVSYFRSRCLSCHTGEAMALKHHPEQQDCAACHMPTRATSDISHEQVTDHDIERSPRRAAELRLTSLGAGGEELKPVGAAAVGDRELGLAYAQMAERGDREAGERALRLLQRAETNGASDAPLHTQLGYLSQLSGQKERAVAEYKLALQGNLFEPSALGNLAVLQAAGGNTGEAIASLRRLVGADPSQTAAGLNLAFVECRMGQRAEAHAVLERLRRLNPDDPQIRAFLATGSYAGQRCPLN